MSWFRWRNKETNEDLETFNECIHADACRRAHELDFGQDFGDADVAADLKCSECTEWNDSHVKAKRILHSQGAIGHCNCSACNWIIDPYDAYCRRCGAKLNDTERAD